LWRPRSGSARRAVELTWTQVWPVLAVLAAILVIWAILSATGLVSTTVLPSPATTWRAFAARWADGTIPVATGKTLLRLAFGFGVAIGLGTLLGLGLAASSFARRSVGSIVVALQAIPSIAVLPLAILWFGFTERAVVFVTIVGAVPSVTLATVTSIRTVPPILRRVGLTMGARGPRLYREVLFPAALPGYIAGLQQAWGFAWRALMAGELITHTTAASGLGQLLVRSQERSDAPVVVAVLLVIIVLGMAMDLLVFRPVDRRVRAKRGLLAVNP